MDHTTKAAFYFFIAGTSLGGLLVAWGIPLLLLAIICFVVLLVVSAESVKYV